MLGGNGTYELLESAASYTSNFDPENDVLQTKMGSGHDKYLIYLDKG